MKRRTRVVVVGGVVVVGLGAGIGVAYGVHAGKQPEDTVTVRSTQDPHDVATYWTDERMRNAKPG
ncbi:hypothetical protein [Actinoallomurus iriomotensis]|uniref:Uncharacterized protein n=1 Tax=Actinoallomurus iriomotensis TaxID=478107 RepID=A0A9W6RUJ8_9ACTN|nr:hypothetical protein [Actinoallomurus iriomotensis]GLY80387.1 hypothetical protein Airi01_086540 [Actinoallomurus iriomotensis]